MADAVRNIIRPTWADPQYLRATTSYRATPITLTANGTQIVAPANPRRWAIGWSAGATPLASVYLAPHAAPDSGPLVVLAALSIHWLTLLTHGAAVLDQWYASGQLGAIIYLHELLID